MAVPVNAQKDFMRGLHNFIAALHNAHSKELEKKRVDKELAKIRREFLKEGKTTADGYMRRKYVCKLLYMYVLGYDLEFGHMEAVTLLSSSKFHEKKVGYLAMALLLNETHEMVPLIINSLQEDLQARSEYNISLALATIANIGGKDMSESLAPHVMNLLISTTTPSAVRKKAALCFLRLYRKNNQILQLDTNLQQKILALLDDHDLGVVNSVVALLSDISASDPSNFEAATPKILKILFKVSNLEYSREYMYHSVPHPWVQVRCLRLLKVIPPSQKQHLDQLTQILHKTFNNTDMPRNATENQRNAINAVLFEAISLVITLDYDANLMSTVVTFLGRFISARETNVRYLGLEAMAHLSQADTSQSQMIRKYQKIVVAALQESDISLRRRSLELLYNMCDKESSKEILVELLNYLATCDVAIKEELVVKIAILAEKFSQTYAWYVDVILQLIRIAGDYVSDEIWFRVIKIVTNNEDIQEYAARTVFKSLKVEPWHENMVKVGGYILGEFGDLIAEQPGSAPIDQFRVLHSRFGAVSINTRALLLSTYAKFANLFPEIKNTIREVLTQHQDHIEVEIQQRACEYLRMTTPNAEQLLQTILDAIPPWEEQPTPKQDKERAQRSSKPVEDDIIGLGSATSVSGGGSLSQTTSALSALQLGQGQQPQQTDLLGGMLGSPTVGLGLGIPNGATGASAGVAGGAMGGIAGINGSIPQGATGIAGLQGMATSATAGAGQGSAMGLGVSGTQGAAMGLGVGMGVGATQGAGVATQGLAGASAAATGAAAGPESSGVGPVQPLGTGLTQEQLQAVTVMWRKLAVVGEGVIFQDANLQIGMKSDYNGSEGRVMLYFGNSSTMPLTKFSVVVQNVSYLNIQVGPAPTVIASRAQATQPIKFQCLREFPDSPLMQVSYVNVNKPVSLVLPLPIFLSKFLTPPESGPTQASTTFLQQWKAMVGVGMESQEILPAKGGIDLAWLSKIFQQGFKMSVLDNVDPLKNNFVLAATLHLGDGPVDVLVRLETNLEANVYRITVRSPRSASSEFLKALFVAQLNAGQ